MHLQSAEQIRGTFILTSISETNFLSISTRIPTCTWVLANTPLPTPMPPLPWINFLPIFSLGLPGCMLPKTQAEVGSMALRVGTALQVGCAHFAAWRLALGCCICGLIGIGTQVWACAGSFFFAYWFFRRDNYNSCSIHLVLTRSIMHHGAALYLQRLQPRWASGQVLDPYHRLGWRYSPSPSPSVMSSLAMQVKKAQSIRQKPSAFNQAK